MLHRRPRFVDRLGTLLLMLLAWGVLLFHLDGVPPGFQHDQTFSALDAKQVLNGHYPIYFPDNFGRGPLFMYSVAGIFHLTGGHWVWSLHFAAVLWGMLALATTILLARRYLPRAAALFVASLMAGSFWFLLAARLGVESISLLPLATAMLFCLARGLAEHSWPQLMLGGILGGIANYTYLASRTLYLLAPLLLVYLLVSALWNKVERRDLLGLSLSFSLTVAVSSPLLIYLRNQPAATADGRLGQLSGALVRAVKGDAGPLLANAWDTVRAILWSGSNALPYQYNVPGRAALQPLWAACLVIGLILTLSHAREQHDFVLLAGLWLGLLPSLLSGADALYMRSICALPLMFILVGRGLWAIPAELKAFSARLMPGRSVPSPSHVPLWSIAGSSMILAGLLAWHMADGFTAYFHTWAEAEPTQRIYNSDFRAAAAFLNAEPSGEQAFIGTDRLRDLDSATFGFYESKRTNVNWFEAPATPPLPSHGEALYLLPAYLGMPPGLAALPGGVRESFWIPAPAGYYNLMRGYRVYADDIQSALQHTGNRPPAQPIVYGDALSLDSASLQDRGTYGELLTSWTVLAPWPHAARAGYPPAKPKFSLSLTDAARYKWSQADVTTSFPFTTWQAGQLLVEDSRLPLPADLPPGEYSVRLAIYDDDQGALSQRSNGQTVASAPAAMIAHLGARGRTAAAPPTPPWPVLATQGHDTALRVLGRWESFADLMAGLPADIHLSWQAVQPVATAGLRFRVIGRGNDGAVLWQQVITPTEQLPAIWQAGQVFRLTHRLVPESPVGGTIQAQVEVCAEKGETDLGCGQIGPTQLSNVPVLMAFPNKPQHPYRADWSGQVSLAGYDLLQSGQQISLTLYWQAGSQAPIPLKRFVHVTDASEAIIAQSDDALQAGEIPATLWRPGQCVIERVALQIPAGKQAIKLYVGLYDPDTGERLPVQLASGQPVSDGRVALPLR